SHGQRLRPAIAWTPRELSLVPLAADPSATVRGERMDTQTEPVETGTDNRAATNAEIRKLVAAAQLDHTVADSLIDRGASIDGAKRELFDAITAKPVIVRSQRIDVGETLDA